MFLMCEVSMYPSLSGVTTPESLDSVGVLWLQGYLVHDKPTPPPWDHQRALDINLL